MIRRRFFPLSLLAVLAFCTLSFSSENKKDDLFMKVRIQPIKGDRKAPDFNLEDLKGRKFGLNHFKGKVVFLNFWATWCGPCKEEMPSMESLFNRFREKGFVFLAVSVDYEGIKPVLEFIGKKSYTFPVLIDPKCETLELFDVKGIPTTFLIDRKGMMVGKAIGPRDWSMQEVIYILTLLLEE